MDKNLLKLYYSPGACSLAPHIILEELGQSYTLEEVSLSQGKQLSPEYRKIHPLQRVPALQLQEEVLTEVSAILLHLADLHPTMNLLPKPGTWQRAQAYEWCSLLSSTLHPAFAQVFRPARYSDVPETHEPIKRSGRSHIQQLFALIEERLRSQPYALGDAYSVCDPYLLVFCRWGYRSQLPMQQYPKFCEHAERLLRRPAVTRAFEQEQISLR